MSDYCKHRYLLTTLDPVHIGTGGYRLGRVDLSIVREPGTNVPKIPGTSLSGAVRSYAAMQFGKPDCAGQKNHCGQPTCPICYTFGSLREEAEGEKQQTYSGTVNLFDATLVLFPVHSMAGPVWVSTWERLKEAGFTPSGERAKLQEQEDGALFTWERKDPLNLGWLVLEAAGQVQVKAPEEYHGERWNAIKECIVIVQEPLFEQAVNSNLEVRTSVSIDPRTGAAEEGALFTYEAIPRAAFLVMEVVQDDYRRAFPSPDRLRGWLKRESGGRKNDEAQDSLTRYEKAKLDWGSPLNVVTSGLKLAGWLGVGGMSTRGFGRLAIVGEPNNKGWGEEKDGKK